MLDGRLLARALGLFSLGLGLVQLVAPGRFSRWIGLRPKEDREARVRAVGGRELAAAVGLLARPLPAFMWLRVAGDVMDMALLRRAMQARDTRSDRAGTAMLAVAGVTALDLLGSVQLTRQAVGRRDGQRPGETEQASRPRHVRKSVSILRPREEVYTFWRDLSNLPRFMPHLEAVEVIDDRRSHWVARAPFGARVEWDAEIVEDVPNERIAWRSLDGSQVQNAGSVRFEEAPGNRGTIVTADFAYDPPGGPLGAAIAKLTGEEPEQQTADDLRRFKQLLETGEVAVSDATYGGRKVRQRPAQPVEAVA